jgi:hypothetical protein
MACESYNASKSGRGGGGVTAKPNVNIFVTFRELGNISTKNWLDWFNFLRLQRS